MTFGSSLLFGSSVERLASDDSLLISPVLNAGRGYKFPPTIWREHQPMSTFTKIVHFVYSHSWCTQKKQISMMVIIFLWPWYWCHHCRHPLALLSHLSSYLLPSPLRLQYNFNCIPCIELAPPLERIVSFVLRIIVYKGVHSCWFLIRFSSGSSSGLYYHCLLAYSLYSSILWHLERVLLLECAWASWNISLADFFLTYAVCCFHLIVLEHPGMHVPLATMARRVACFCAYASTILSLFLSGDRWPLHTILSAGANVVLKAWAKRHGYTRIF